MLDGIGVTESDVELDRLRRIGCQVEQITHDDGIVEAPIGIRFGPGHPRPGGGDDLGLGRARRVEVQAISVGDDRLEAHM